MALADVHCHLGMYLNPARVAQRAREADVEVVAATSRASEYRGLRSEDWHGVTYGLGLHPECAGSVYAPLELEIFASEVEAASWISEVGLDGVIAERVSPHFGATPSLIAQQQLFETVLDIAGADRIYSVHSRGAASATLDILRSHGCQRVVLHSFDGSPEESNRAVMAGYYFSIHPTMLDSAKGRDLIRMLPDDLLLLESDGPYFEWLGHRIEPAHCREMVVALASVRSWSPADLEASMARNFAALTAGAGMRH